MNQEGLPTGESLRNLMRSLSDSAGQQGSARAAYCVASDAETQQMLAYIQERMDQNKNSEREPYTLLNNNCGTFCVDTLRAGDVFLLPFSRHFHPLTMIERLRIQADASITVEREDKEDITVKCNVIEGCEED